jgi:hypothetical protein
MPRFLLAALVAFGLAACAAPPGGRLAPPEGCVLRPMPGNPGGQSCSFEAEDGAVRSILLQEGRLLMSVADRAALGRDPAGFMARRLARMEAEAVAVEDRRILRARATPVPADRLTPGAEACLRFDFDTLTRAPDGRRVRLNNAGRRCLARDPATGGLRYVFLEALEAGPPGGGRTDAYAAFARRAIGTLRMD